MPTRILRDWTDRLKEIADELATIPKLDYSDSSPETSRLSVRKWQLFCERRRIRLRIARTKGTHTREEWNALVEAANKRCPRCGGCLKDGSKLKTSKDHIIPISKGGSDAIENIQVLCNRCNAGKGNR